MTQDLFGDVPAAIVQDRERKTTLPRGHAAPPGSGPKGETCRTCEHYTLRRYHDYVHRKCGLMQAVWTNGPGSDIRAKDPACRNYGRDRREAND